MSKKQTNKSKEYIFKIGKKEHKIKIWFGRYVTNGRLAMIMVKRSELFADITVNLSLIGFRSLNEDEIIVKTYDCLENLDQWLIDNNIATHTGEYIKQNYISAPVMKLTPEFIKENQEAIALAGME